MRYSPLYKLYFNHKFQYIYIIIICAIYGNYLVFLQNIRNKNFIPLSIGLALIYKFGFLKILVFFGCTGFGFTFLASLSHINNNCIQPNNDKKNDFLYNQVSSSMNYRTDDFITRFICLGLDIQIEHHIFPNIPHSSLRKIQNIVYDYCTKNDIPYIEKPNIIYTIYLYYSYLYKMGRE